ncbi:MAG: NCS2 family permease [Armatimonadota bacterium]
MLDKIFRLKENNTTIQNEVRGGIVTFMTMSYIIFVQPALLNQAGMDFGAVMVATCLSAALATFIMGLYANYPICQAPLMGENAFFVFTVVIGMGISWQAALGAVFVSGIIFLILTFAHVRELIINAVPDTLKYSIACGIGLFITFIGLQLSGIIANSEATLVKLGNFKEPAILLSIFGLLFTSILVAKKVKGAFLWGMLATTVIGLITKLVVFHGIASMPPSLDPTFLKLDVKSVFHSYELVIISFAFLFMLIFDTIGTLIGVSTQAGLLKDGKLPRINKALISDAAGTIFGSLVGTSTVSSYIESSTGVAEGARTGLANMITGILFIAALFFMPIIKMISGGVPVGDMIIQPVIAPVLILVGSMMMLNITKIKWEDSTDAIPAFLTIAGMPFTYSIVDGMAFGFITYPLVKLFSGRGRQVSILMYILGGIFLARYIFLCF